MREYKMRSFMRYQPQIIIDDVLRRQRKGEVLTLAERNAVKRYAEEQRKKKLSQKKRRK